MKRIWRRIFPNFTRFQGGGGQPAEAATAAASADHNATETQSRARATFDKIKGLPKPVGVVLIGAGVAIMPFPGPMGMPLVLAGGLVLAPQFFGEVERFLERKYPDVHGGAVEFVERFFSDMERRFPSQQE